MIRKRLNWMLGLMTAMHEAMIPEGALVAGENFDVSDGSVRLGARYILKAQIESASRTPRGSGWGKFGSNEEYLLVSNTAMYFCPTPAASTWTAVSGGSGLNASDWYFQQFGSYMYAANGTDGIGRKVIGTNSFSLLSLPTAPASAPGATFYIPPDLATSGTGGTLTATGASSSSLNADYVEATYTSAGVREVTIEFDTSPDLRPDLIYRDMGYSRHLLPPGVSTPTLILVDGATEYEAITWFEETAAGNNKDVFYRWQNVARGSRDPITKIKWRFTTPAGTSLVRLWMPRTYQVWMSIDSQTNPGSGYPTFRSLQYEVTYYNSTTGLESPPSPVKTLPANTQSGLGNWVNLTASTSAESGVDFVRFYRRVDNGGVITRYRLTSVANSGSPAYTDKLPLEEVESLTIFTPSVLPETGITAMCAWQNRIALGVGTLCYISQEDDELKFEPSTGAYDPFNPGRGLTFYPDDKKGESILALVGQDDLYICTGYSVRCLLGNTPDNWRLIKLPDIEGICGARAVCAYKKGILCLTPSGRLLYHHSSLLEPTDISEDVQAKSGEAGITEMATSDAVVGVSPDGDIYVMNAAGRYYIRSTDGRWRRGTWTHGVHSLLFVSGMAIRWIGANSKLYEGGDLTYVSDGGTTGTNGTAVTYSATVGRLSMDRSRLDNIYFGDATGTTPYPKATVYSQENQSGAVYEKTVGKKNKRTKVTDEPMGEWFKVKLEGDKDTVFDDVRIDFYTLSQTRQK